MATKRRSVALLERSAPLARLLSDSLCRSRNGHDDCGALHGLWTDLRLVDLAADPARHADFYASALGARAAGGRSPRVLIAGCADWGMLETATAAYRRRRAALDVTVVDRCPTPGLMCAWYGAQAGVSVRTAVADVARFRDGGPFDLICTHSLLTYPTVAARRRLVANWRRLLRPGGAVVTVTRLSSKPAAPIGRAERARRFGDLVVARCAEVGLLRDSADLRARAERFARAQVGHRVGDAEDLRALFEQQGFEVARLEVRRLGGAVGAREPIRGAARGGIYGEIVAVRA